MYKVIPFLRLIRWPNLLMTGIGIISIWYFLIYHLHQPSILKVNFVGILLLAISFIFIMAAGYIVNDIYDIEIDAINKPGKQIIGNYFTINQGWHHYIILNLCGLVVSICAAILYDRTLLLAFLPVGITSLYIYSKWLKKSAPWGNMLISVLCMLALWMPAFGEWQLLQADPILFKKFLICSLIAGICMFMREIVKSQEDITGDCIYQVRTLPLVWGMDTVNGLMSALNLITILFIFFILYYFNIPIFMSLILITAMAIPLILFQILLLLTSTRANYSLQSKILKLIMASGMIVLPWALSNFRS